MGYQEIRTERAGTVLIIHLDRPEKLNAYTPDMGDELVDAYRGAAADPGLRAVILTGSGRVFCAGADRAYLAGARSRSGKRLGEEEFISGFAEELATLPLLSIAAINGAAVGIGVTATLPMDLRIVATDAQLVLNFAELGIMPGLGSTYFLPHLVGVARARELLLCTRRIDGEEAATIGLANRAVAGARVLPTALELAYALGDCGREVVAAIKRGLALGASGTLTGALEYERQLAAQLRAPP